MSNDPSIYNAKQRIRFRCVAWNQTQGLIKDEQGCEYKILAKHLSPGCGRHPNLVQIARAA